MLLPLIEVVEINDHTKGAAALPHSKPVAVALLAFNTWPFVPTAILLKASAPVPATRSPLASMAVAIELVIVTVPEVPPPLIPTPAVTPSMSPALVTQLKSMSVLEFLARTCPVVPPLRSTREASIASPSVSIAVAPSFTKSVEVGTLQPKLGVVVAIYFSFMRLLSRLTSLV